MPAASRRDGHPLFVYFGHHKAASTWINRHVRAISRELGIKQTTVPSPSRADNDLGAFVERSGIGFLSYTNADREHIHTLPPFRAFHVVRDPRDIAVSAFYSHRETHQLGGDWIREHRATLHQVSPEEGLLLEIERSSWNFGHMRDWDYGRDDVLELRMEELTRDPFRGWLQVVDFLGVLNPHPMTKRNRWGYLIDQYQFDARQRTRNLVPAPTIQTVPAERVLYFVSRFDFRRLTGGREPGQEDTKSHFRKGLPGDWRNHFTPEHRKLFDELWGDILIQLGYEPDHSWVDEVVA